MVVVVVVVVAAVVAATGAVIVPYCSSCSCSAPANEVRAAAAADLFCTNLVCLVLTLGLRLRTVRLEACHSSCVCL